MRSIRVMLIAVFCSACFVAHRASDLDGVMRLAIIDSQTNRDTPARIELRDSTGQYLVPKGALPLVDDCGKIPLDMWAPAAAVLQTRWGQYRGIRNPYRGSTNFYAAGPLEMALRPGRYRMRVEKGPEFRVIEHEVVVDSGKTQTIRLVLDRWINLPAEGWYSSDEHLHIPRPSPGLDPALAAWMQAEDIHVANLLQMGFARDMHETPQRSFGAASVYRAGTTLLVSGQENPRTQLLGHSIILGGYGWIDFPAAYLLYDRPWREARRQGAVSGYAHLGMAGAQDGLAVWGEDGLIDFIEVLNLGFPLYQGWYDALNLGERVAPTAGTDFPCLAELPGRERFYARVDGGLAFPAWLDAVRRGRTFVTNGPLLDFSLNGASIGDEVSLGAPGAVRVRARVRFDPSRDRVDRLEIVQGGRVVAAAHGPAAGEIGLDIAVPISASTWLAARISGEKVGERPSGSVESFARYIASLGRKADANARATLNTAARPRQIRISAAHTGPIYIRVRGTPAIAEQAAAREVAKARLELLDDLVSRLDDPRLRAWLRFPGPGDGVTPGDLRRDRAILLRCIQSARAHYQSLLRGAGAAPARGGPV